MTPEPNNPLAELISAVEDHKSHIDRRLDEVELRFERQSLETDRQPVKGTGPFLEAKQALAPHFRVEQPDYNVKAVRFGSLIAALVGGRPVLEQLSQDEIKAFSGLSQAGGSYLIPSGVGSLFIDAARARSVVHEAGALSFPMQAGTVSLPGWDSPPSASFRAEEGAFTSAGGSFRAVTLVAQMCQAYADVSIEMIEDAANNLPGVAQIIEQALAKAIATAIDTAALVGNGTGQPLGLAGITGVGSIVFGTGNGATPLDYDKLLDAIAAVELANFEPTAFIHSPRTVATLRKLVTGIASDKTKLEPPPAIAALPQFVTAELPIDLTVGTSEDCSISFCGDFSQLLIGYRPDVTVKVLSDPYTQMAATGNVRVYAWSRVDVAALVPAAFVKLTGIRAV